MGVSHSLKICRTKVYITWSLLLEESFDKVHDVIKAEDKVPCGGHVEVLSKTI